MVKISPRPKRCRICHRKGQRHESVYGCLVCNVNLCKTTGCFQEFHRSEDTEGPCTAPFNACSSTLSTLKMAQAQTCVY
ncbi:UNVERIFIED_CONTAM: hypothetical protein FKN15_041171 [Acipenser sinensis]